MKRNAPSIFFLLLIGLALGCGSFGTVETVDGDSSEEEPTSGEGTGKVVGSVKWNSRAAANIHVELCEEYNFFNGCTGDSFSTLSDENGTYLFTEIPPGTYYIAMRIFNTDDWLYLTEGFISAQPFPVAEAETTVVEAYNLYKLDIKPTHPTDAVVSPGELTLSWRPYESAAYYKITVYPDHGESILSGQRVDSNEATITLPYPNCEYRWQVEAFNQDAIKIAATDGFLTFAVAGQTTSCVLTLTGPVDNAVLASGSDIVLMWEEHDAAARYDVLMWNDSLPDRPHILDFVGTTVPTLHIGQTLVPGRYVWSVRAFDENDQQIAGSEVADFIVE